MRSAWAEGYAAQSRSDFATYQILAAASGVAECQRLHYLQMTGEKIAKAYRFRDTDTPLEKLLSSHVAFSKFFGSYLGSPTIKQRYEGRDHQLAAITKTCRQLAQAIEKLAPAVDRSISPANTEYPWAEGTTVVVPCDFTFPGVSLLREKQGITFLKMLQTALDDFEAVTIH